MQRSPPHTCPPRPGYKAIEKTYQRKRCQKIPKHRNYHKGWTTGCQTQQTLCTLKRMHHCPTTSSGRPIDCITHSAQPSLQPSTEAGLEMLSVCLRHGQGNRQELETEILRLEPLGGAVNSKPRILFSRNVVSARPVFELPTPHV